MRAKLVIQILVALIASCYLTFFLRLDTHLYVPFLKNTSPDLGWFFVIFAMLVIVGTSNAVNLTDGLDGLAIGPTAIAFGTYLVFVYCTGHYKIAQYLQIPFIKGGGELAVFCADARWEATLHRCLCAEGFLKIVSVSSFANPLQRRAVW